MTVEARAAQCFVRLLRCLDKPVKRDVAERVRADRRADLLDRRAARDQLVARREVDAVEAGPLDRR